MSDQAASGHRFNPTILREYDIRGIVGDTLHDERCARHRASLRHDAGEERRAERRGRL